MRAEGVAIGIDLGASKLGAALVSIDGEILAERRVEVAGMDEKEIIGRIRELILSFKSEAVYPVMAVGIGVPGQVSFDGIITFAPNLKWRNVPLARRLQAAIALPVVVLNDVRAAVWGEWSHGAGRGCRDLLCLFIGSGIGGGIVAGGELLVGSANSAGEAGHFTLVLDGRLCGCGRRGCFEAYASGIALSSIMREMCEKESKRAHRLLSLVNGDSRLLRPHHLAEALRLKDSLAQELFERFSSALVAGITGLVNLINPEKVLLGGGIVNGFPSLLASIDERVRAAALSSASAHLQIIQAALGDRAPLVGAAMAALNIRVVKERSRDVT